VWQALYEELGDHGFVVIAVALDSDQEAPLPWIERAAPTYPVLIDREHRLAELYNLVNVPQAVWIDEEGRIVRPPEVAGAYEAFRRLDPATGRVPEEELATSRAVREAYLGGIRDWVRNGSASTAVLPPSVAAGRLSLPDEHTAQAHAAFRLGQCLLRQGNETEGRALLEEAAQVHPESWAIWRQAADKTDTGIAGGAPFWERVQALGEKRYYTPIELEGMPEH
jgi:hypothetical protein